MKIFIGKSTRIFYFIIGFIMLIAGIMSILQNEFMFAPLRTTVLVIFGLGVLLISFKQKFKYIQLVDNGILFFDGTSKKEYLNNYSFCINTYKVLFKDRAIYALWKSKQHEIQITNNTSKNKLKTTILLDEVSNKQRKQISTFLNTHHLEHTSRKNGK